MTAVVSPSRPSLPDARPLIVVLDTNVIMALWHFNDPRLQVLKAWVEGDTVRLVQDEPCVQELGRVLAYRQFAIEPAVQAALLAEFCARSQAVAVPNEAQRALLEALPRCGDRDDQKFIELAVHAKAHLLVTRDKLVLKLARRRELRDHLLIITPERLQQIITSD